MVVGLGRILETAVMNIQYDMGNTVRVALSSVRRRNCVVRNFFLLVAFGADHVLASFWCVDWRDPADGVLSSFPLLGDCEGNRGVSGAVNVQRVVRQAGLGLFSGNHDAYACLITILVESGRGRSRCGEFRSRSRGGT
jgi:hypothetical protein